MPLSYRSGTAATAPIVSSGGVISITPASGSLAGSMSIGDFVKLGAGTSLNTASTIVMRDASGNFAAGTVTATLTGTSSNAANLNGQTPASYLARANHTGTQGSSSIFDFDAQVRSNRLDQLGAPTAAVGFGGQRLTALAPPTNGSDAVNKDYVDASIASGAGQIVSGTGLTKSGNILNAGAGVGILTNPDDIAIDTSIVARKFSQTIGDGISTTISVTHGLNNLNPEYSLSLVAAPFTKAITTIAGPTLNTVSFTFAVAPTIGQYRAILIG